MNSPTSASGPVIGPDMVVAIYYTLTDDQGAVLDTTKGKRPLSYMHGRGGLIKGLEKALEGKSKDAHIVVSIPPEEAYGPHKPEGLQKMARAGFPKGAEVVPGKMFTMSAPNQPPRPVRVHAVEGEEVVIDLNHPMAGKTLHFDVLVAGVRAATEEEKTHGHVHGPGGHHH